MPQRIDAARGRMRGVSLNRTSLASADGSAIAGGLMDVAAVLAQREDKARREEAERQAKADRLAIAQQSARAREELTADYNARTAEYDGSAPGFADALGEEYAARIEQWVAAADPRLADDLEISLSGVVDNFRLAAVNYESGQREAHLLRGVGEQIETEIRSVQENPATLALARANADLAIEAAPDALQPQLRQEQYARLGAAALTGLEAKAPRQGLAALDRGDFNDYLEPEAVARWRDRLTREVERRDREAERQAEKIQRQAAAVVKTEMADIDRLRELGLVVSAERLDALERTAQAAGPEAVAEVTERRLAGRVADEIARMPYGAAVDAVSRLRADLENVVDAPRGAAMALGEAEKTLSGMVSALEKDPLAFAANHRGGVAPFEFSDPIGSLKRRKAEAEEAADYYGVPTRYFTNDERDAIAAKLDADSNARSLFIEAAASAGTPAMVKELAPSIPEIAHLAGVRMGGGSRQFVEDVLTARDLMQSGDFPTTIEFGQAAEIQKRVLGDAYMVSPETHQSVIKTAGLAYDARSKRNSRGADDFDKRDYETALREAAGATADGKGGVVRMGVGGERRVVAAPSWVPSRNFPALWRSLDPSVYEAAGPALTIDGKKIATAQLQRGFPVAVGDGVYALDFSRNPERPQFALREDGSPYTVDLNQLRGKGDLNDIAGEN